MPVIAEFMIKEKIRVAVWQITETEIELAARAVLSPADSCRLAGLKHPRRRLQWLACRAALKSIAGDLQIPVVYDPHGKPVYENSLAHISFTHSGNLAAALYSPDLPAGLDIEEPRERIRKVRDRFLSQDETKQLPEVPCTDHLYYYWCAKEALYKISGHPGIDFQNDIQIHPFDYLCTPEFSAKAEMNTAGTRSVYELFFTKINGYILAVASPAGRNILNNTFIP